ncbi:T-complex protein 11 [Plasmodiophora brassicae]|uniref:Uncharacterized protein n=1 Tax=Plasmodiophora brassicae TaxID=37360 RepID=A0A0G4IS63_PLABS|nr:hypothetical protein PBRA_006123 [Plasmodiophora brassicae]SPQ96166.1 unnamed protein product [Plasmodiophora brassicae]
MTVRLLVAVSAIVAYAVADTTDVSQFLNVMRSQTNATDPDTYITFLCRREVIKSAQRVVSHWPNVDRASARTLTSAFMITKFPSEVLDDLSSSTGILAAAQDLVNDISSDKFAAFKIALAMHKDEDRPRAIAMLTDNHRQWLESNDFVEKQGSVDPRIADGVRDNLGRSRDRIRKFGGEPLLEQIEKQIRDEQSARYWEEFRQELMRVPPVFDRAIKLLDEIRDRLQQLVPHRPDLHESIDNAIDIPFITQMVSHNAFDNDEFTRLFGNIWVLVKELGAPADDADWNHWRSDVDAATGPEFRSHLPSIFNHILCRLDRIEELTSHYRPIAEQSIRRLQEQK